MYTNPKHLIQLITALEQSGWRRVWHTAWPDVIAQKTTSDPPMLIKNIYLGRGNTRESQTDLRLLQILHELGLEVKICYNFDTTKLYDLTEVNKAGPVFQFTTGTVLTYKTKLRRLLKELKLVEDDPTQADPLRGQIDQLKAKLTAVGELDEEFTQLATTNPTPPMSTIVETTDQRMARLVREGDEAREAEKALLEMQRLIQADATKPALLDPDDAAAIVAEMQHADLEAQNRYEQSLREKEGGA